MTEISITGFWYSEPFSMVVERNVAGAKFRDAISD